MSSLKDILPLSMRLTSRMSFTRLNKWSLDNMILRRQSRTRSVSFRWSSAMDAKPEMEFMGVRKSWDILVRKVDFAWLACSARSSAFCSATFWRSCSRISPVTLRAAKMTFESRWGRRMMRSSTYCSSSPNSRR